MQGVGEEVQRGQVSLRGSEKNSLKQFLERALWKLKYCCFIRLGHLRSVFKRRPCICNVRSQIANWCCQTERPPSLYATVPTSEQTGTPKNKVQLFGYMPWRHVKECRLSPGVIYLCNRFEWRTTYTPLYYIPTEEIVGWAPSRTG